MTETDYLINAVLDEKYCIQKLLGKGGMGAVYMATHVGTRRTVAVKVINPEFLSNEEFIERFKREAEAAGRLRHPNVVDVTDFGFARTGGKHVAYLVMEYLDGCTLAEVLSEVEALPLDWVVDIMEQVCSAVDAAHQMGVVHRDLKPENIWLEPNCRGGFTIKVLDFGLAKVVGTPLDTIERANEPATDLHKREDIAAAEAVTLHHSSGEAVTMLRPSSSGGSAGTGAAIAKSEFVTSIFPAERSGVKTAGISEAALTRFGSIMGTPFYMSPEQIRGSDISAASDIYSIGVITYRMLSGTAPYTGTVESVLKQHAEAAIPSVKGKNSRVPRQIVQLISSAMAKEPSKRPSCATGFACALRARAVGPGNLLQKAMSLYSEHFQAIIRLSLLAHLPLAAVTAVLLLVDKILPGLPQGTLTLILEILIVMLVPATLLSFSVLSAVAVPMIIQLSLMPLQRPGIRNAFALMRKRLRPLLTTALFFILVVIGGGVALGYPISLLEFAGPGILIFVLSLLPGLVLALYFILFGPVVVIEGLTHWKALVRAGSLMRRAWRSVLVISLVQLATPIIVGVAFKQFTFSVTNNSFSFNIQLSGFWSAVIFFLSFVVVNPLLAIITALLYLKTRQAGGETLCETLENLNPEELTQSKWQALLRGRKSSISSTEPLRQTRS